MFRLRLPKKVHNALAKGGITDAEELITIVKEGRKDELFKIRNFDKMAWDQLIQRLVELGIIEGEQ